MNPDETPEDQNTRLALALLEDDEGVLDEILRCFSPPIIKSLQSRYVTRMQLLRDSDIEDVVSIALHRLWEARANYNDKKQKLRVWFYCIAENVAKDVLKHGWYKARRLERNPGSDWLDEKQDPSCPDPAIPPSGKEKRARSNLATDLEKALNKLSHEYRVILLADAAERDGIASNNFLADELGIPAAHIRVYRPRANAALRKEMKKLGHDIPEPRKDIP
jgi:RNA polymerase sigma factor (sigma-70 family)